MKKFVKLSLVAAVAVAGLTTANAKPLEEAIKGVDVTGTVAYRYEEASAKTGAEEGQNYYNAVIDVTVPAGDDLAMGLSFQAGDAASLPTTTTQMVGNNSATVVHLTGANFTYTGLTNTSITAGLQAIPTPWTVASDAMGATHSGTGILAVSTFAPVTLVGAYFNQTDIDFTTNLAATNKGQDVVVAGAILNIAGVNAEAMYATSRDMFDSYTLAAGYKLDLDGVKLGFSARYTELDAELAATPDQKTTKGAITIAAGMFDGKVAYGENGNTGGLVYFDGSAKTTMEGWNTELGSVADSKYLQLSAGMKVLPTVHVSLNYGDRDAVAAANDETETYVQVKYQASKSLATYVRLGNLETNTTDGSAGRLHVQYSF